MMSSQVLRVLALGLCIMLGSLPVKSATTEKSSGHGPIEPRLQEDDGECVFNLLQLSNGDIRITTLPGKDESAKRKKIKIKSSSMEMPVCAVEYDEKKRRYKIRFQGGEAYIKRKYVLESDDKPSFEINCELAGVHREKIPGGSRGSGEDPCQ